MQPYPPPRENQKRGLPRQQPLDAHSLAVCCAGGAVAPDPLGPAARAKSARASPSPLYAWTVWNQLHLFRPDFQREARLEREHNVLLVASVTIELHVEFLAEIRRYEAHPREARVLRKRQLWIA